MSEELIAAVADAIELVTVERQGQGFHLVTGRNDSEAFARAALSVLEPRIDSLREALLWCSRHAGGEIADDACLAELKYVEEVVRLRIEVLERELAGARQARDFYAGRYAERCGDVLAEQGWQDIATAPKDGTRVIVYSTTDTPHYADQDYVATVLQGEHVEEVQVARWCEDAEEWELQFIGAPLFWRPLPPPPTGEGE